MCRGTIPHDGPFVHLRFVFEITGVHPRNNMASTCMPVHDLSHKPTTLALPQDMGRQPCPETAGSSLEMSQAAEVPSVIMNRIPVINQN